MNHRNTRRAARCLAAAALLTASSLAMAQYIWLDERGVKQLSDRPPPPDVPDKRILKAPGKPVFNPNQPADPPPAAPPADTPHRPSWVERNADFNKRQAEAAEAQKKAAAEAQFKADKAANCEAARQNQMMLDQDIRLATFDKNGERRRMSDEERDELRKKTQKVLADCK